MSKVGYKNPPKEHRIKKGQVLNPEGGRSGNPALRALRKLTVETYREVIELALSSNIAALKKVAEDPNTAAVQVGVAVALIKAIQKGDWTVINAIAERIVGKIPDKLEVKGEVGPRIIVTLPSNGREVKKLPDGTT